MSATIAPGVRISSVFAAVFGFCLLAASPAAAQNEFGVRAGVTSSPDQFHFGGHYDTGPLFDKVSFRPNLEVGVGNSITTVAVNFEFVYWIPVHRHPWRVYAGGGPALNVYRYYDASRYGFDHTDTKPGFNLLVGLAHRRGFFAEAKVGLIDSPNAKFSVGYAWR